MNIPNFIEKAKPFVRQAEVFVEASETDEIVAYSNENEAISFIVNHNNQWMALSENNDFEYFFEPIDVSTVDLKNYTALTTKNQLVYPNFEHLLHFGDEEIQDFVKQNDCDKDDLFDLQSIHDEGYIDFWMDHHPMYNNDGVYSYKGGWAMIWPDDDIPMQWDENLEFVYQVGVQNEPFIEIYYSKSDKNFICVERNT
ncbi:hypothetical protein [Sphingobacterium bovistauri]|uniref:Uncharacterized protein n=1 Tax=Sphingobacterium bovistauri TaxID=2781959 RepID=A0ABS7Z4Y1_9SPHI|nr:hypothetical protein [Sphingobacterium bovistauri]MCA5005251.1 hypothetical protein [Sphingobacterium bovistauri]